MTRIVVLDIGGTSIKSGLWINEKLIEVNEVDTNAKKGGKHLMEKVTDIISSYGACQAIGISTAGDVDISRGSIYYANENIPGYTGMKVREILEDRFKVPVAVENDVNAAAIGEMVMGAAKELSDFLCLTYGTGVGGAIVINRDVYRGHTYAAGNFGRILLYPDKFVAGDDYSGSYERYASTSALVREALKYNPSLTNGRLIMEKIKERDIEEIVDRWISEIVYGLVNLINIINPPHIIIGGGIMVQDIIIKKIKDRLKEYPLKQAGQVKISKALLGNTAGLVGAAFLANKRLKQGL